MKLVKAPLGLLEFLRAKVQGNNPSGFADVVAGVVDVTGFYGADSWAPVGTSNVGVITAGVQEPAVAGNNATLSARRLMCFSGEVLIGAAAGAHLAVLLYGAYQGSNYYLASQSFVPVVGGSYRVTETWPGTGLIVPPGFRLGVAVRGNAAGADHNVFLELGYQRLDGLP